MRARTGTLRMYAQDMLTERVAATRRATLRGGPDSSRGRSKKDDSASTPAAAAAAARMKWEDECGESNLIKMDQLSVDDLVENLRVRYEAERYYTLCGTILVALNPYYALHNSYYTLSIINQYKGRRMMDNPPHLFAIADAAYNTLVEEGKSVSCIISGESGAGKSETTKLILNYISAMNNQGSSVEAMLIESSSLLEAFGNAKTCRNKNSSRFGKYIKVRFTPATKIAGAEIDTYLLEKSRVTNQPQGERSYHIFYQLCDGASPAERKRYHLLSSSEFNYTRSCTDIGNDEAVEWRDTKDALTLFGFSPETQDFIFRLCAGVLHLGQVEFKGDEHAQVANPEAVSFAAEMFGVSKELLTKVLTIRVIEITGQSIDKPLPLGDAANTRDTLAREIYSRLFNWLVTRVNAALKPKSAVVDMFMGVLDIFGFENFEVNGFEQLCINYANEKLHQQFIEHVFKLEQEEYAAEDIDWSSIEAPDNQEILTMIEDRRAGVLAMLDEECRMASSTDTLYLEKLERNMKDKACFEKPRLRPSEFIVKHYAEPVSYEVEGFRAKNRNVMADDAMEAIQSSKLDGMAALFATEQTPQEAGNGAKGGRGGTRRGVNTVGSVFKRQLLELKEQLDRTHPFYVRCIKPNHVQQPHNFDAGAVAKQLAYSGMVETVRIRQLGFPNRMKFGDFVGRYGCIAASASGGTKQVKRNGAASADAVRALLKVAELSRPEEAQVGKTKVFMRVPVHEALERKREAALLTVVTRIQAHVRMFVARKRFRAARAAALRLQRNWHIFKANRRSKRLVAACYAVIQRTEASRAAQREAEAAARAAEEAKRAAEEAEAKRKAELAEKKAAAKEAARRRVSERVRAARERAEAETKRRADAAEAKRKEEEARKAEEEEALRAEEARKAEEERKAADAQAQAALEEERQKLQAERERIQAEAEAAERARVAADVAALEATRTAEAEAAQAIQARKAKQDAERQRIEAELMAERADDQATAEDDPSITPSSIMGRELPRDYPGKKAYLREMANDLQRNVKTRAQGASDRLFEVCLDVYAELIAEDPYSPDNYINAATTFINWAHLRMIMPTYVMKTPNVWPLLDQALEYLRTAEGGWGGASPGLSAAAERAVEARRDKLTTIRKRALELDNREMASLRGVVVSQEATIARLHDEAHVRQAKLDAVEARLEKMEQVLARMSSH